MRRKLCALLLAAASLAAPAAGQQPTQRQMDSLAAQVRQLRARLDSVLRVLSRQAAAPQPVAAPVGDDLAALRAAASQAAGGGGRDTAQGDTLTQAMGRERNQAQLNPEIGVTGDVRGYATGRGVQRDNFDPREFEVSFTYKLNQRFILGARYDYVESPDSGIIRQVVPSLTMWQSEWVFLRAQYQWRQVVNRPAEHQIALQAVWAIGPHKHETY